MSLRLTLGLVAAALLVGAVAYINPFAAGEEEERERPWFYLVAEEDIERIEVTHQANSVAFVKVGPNQWEFEDPAEIPPSHFRWAGIPLLLSGPQTNRDLTLTTTTIDDRAQYGLDDPPTVVDVTLTRDRQIQFRFGDKTTDGEHHYGEVPGFPQLFLIADTWGDVISRLAAEPPYPKWYVRRTPEEAIGLAVYMGNPTDKEVPKLQFRKQKDIWTVKDFTVDEDRIPADVDRMKDIVPLLLGPSAPSVVVPFVEDKDYAPWGITDDSIALEIEFEGLTEQGTEFTDAVGFQLGTRTPDGTGYYAKYGSARFEFRLPVLRLDAEWVDAVLAFWDDIPYDLEARAELKIKAEARAKDRAIRATATAEAGQSD